MRFMVAIALLYAGSTPFQLRGEADIVIPVTIDGQGPFRFLLDTGSSRSAISRDTARRLNRMPVGHTVVVTPSGGARRSLVAIDRISIGSGPPASVMAMVVSSDDLDAGIDGLIGQDVLRTRRYTIDYRHRRLVWHSDTSGVASGIRLPLEWNQDRFIVSLPQQARARDLRLVPDSGTDGWVFFTRRDGKLPPLTPLDPVGLRTLTGVRVLRRVLVDRIDVGRLRMLDQTATLLEQPEAGTPFEDGLLPLHLFARVRFDGPDKQLIIEPR